MTRSAVSGSPLRGRLVTDHGTGSNATPLVDAISEIAMVRLWTRWAGSASAAAEPPDDPPGVRDRSYGLFVVP